MELIIVLVIVAGIIGLLYFRSKGTAKVEKVEETHAWPATDSATTEPKPAAKPRAKKPKMSVAK